MFSLSGEIDIDVFNARKLTVNALFFLTTGAFNIVLYCTTNCYCTVSLIADSQNSSVRLIVFFFFKVDPELFYSLILYKFSLTAN